jgi:hypothetical protein
MTQPFNLALHEMMLARGARHWRIEENWEETGDPENGPGGLSGWPNIDQYIDSTHEYYVTEAGRIDVEPRNFEFERYAEDQLLLEQSEEPRPPGAPFK